MCTYAHCPGTHPTQGAPHPNLHTCTPTDKSMCPWWSRTTLKCTPKWPRLPATQLQRHVHAHDPERHTPHIHLRNTYNTPTPTHAYTPSASTDSHSHMHTHTLSVPERESHPHKAINGQACWPPSRQICAYTHTPPQNKPFPHHRILVTLHANANTLTLDVRV